MVLWSCENCVLTANFAAAASEAIVSKSGSNIIQQTSSSPNGSEYLSLGQMSSQMPKKSNVQAQKSPQKPSMLTPNFPAAVHDGRLFGLSIKGQHFAFEVVFGR